MEIKLTAVLKGEAKSHIENVDRGAEVDKYIGMTRVIIRQGIVQSELPLTGPISEEIESFIVGVRLETCFYESTLGLKRAKGKYVLPDNVEVTGVVELRDSQSVRVSCYGPNREGVILLYELIRSGNIRPVGDGWDKEQIDGGPDRLKEALDLLQAANAGNARLSEELAELAGVRDLYLKARNELGSLKETLGSWSGEIAWLQTELCKREGERDDARKDAAKLERDLGLALQRVNGVYQLSVDLKRGGWPFCQKKAVASRIISILDSVDKQ